MQMNCILIIRPTGTDFNAYARYLSKRSEGGGCYANCSRFVTAVAGVRPEKN